MTEFSDRALIIQVSGRHSLLPMVGDGSDVRRLEREIDSTLFATVRLSDEVMMFCDQDARHRESKWNLEATSIVLQFHRELLFEEAKVRGAVALIGGFRGEKILGIPVVLLDCVREAAWASLAVVEYLHSR